MDADFRSNIVDGYTTIHIPAGAEFRRWNNAKHADSGGAYLHENAWLMAVDWTDFSPVGCYIYTIFDVRLWGFIVPTRCECGKIFFYCTSETEIDTVIWSYTLIAKRIPHLMVLHIVHGYERSSVNASFVFGLKVVVWWTWPSIPTNQNENCRGSVAKKKLSGQC